jgi:hypothetical protein
MTPNKEFISQKKENLAKMRVAKAPQFNPDDGSFRKLLGIKENEIVYPSFARAILKPQIPNGKISVTENNPTDIGKKSIILNTEVSK